MPRNPKESHAWLIGSGIASLAAAVYLIRDAKMTAINIHILDVHARTGGRIKSCGNAEYGYVLYAGSLPYFHDRCVDELLSLVLNSKAANKTILGTIYDFEREEIPKPPEHAATRIIRQGDKGLEKVAANQLHIRFQ
jgi:oleate hydratase